MSAQPKRRVLRHTPQNRLASLLNRPGGIARDAAIAESTRLLEEMRDPAMEAVDNMIAELESVVVNNAIEPKDRLAKIERLADRLINLADTFNLPALSDATKRLFDLAHAFSMRGIFHPLPISVHVRAVRLLGPRSVPVNMQDAINVLTELRRVLTHFGIEVCEIPPMEEHEPTEQPEES